MTDPLQPQPTWLRWQRALLPGAVRDASGGGRSPRDWVVDALMLMLAVGIGAFVLSTTWSEHSEDEAFFDLVAGTVAIAALWWRRSRPFAVALITILLSAVSAFAAGAGLLALFTAAIRTSPRRLALLTVLSLVISAIFPLLYPSHDAYSTELLFGLLLTVVVIGWGLFARVQREYMLALRDRAAQLESEQRLQVEQAREAERRRIAREMHDVLAHRVSLLSLHAGALEFRPDAPPQEVAEAAGVIRAAAHDALQELREVIGLLREGDGSGGSLEPPQPTLAQIPALVEESRAAGMRVRCGIELGDHAGDPLPDVLGRTAYRIVQEGLTNARKHAPAAAVEVRVAAGEGPRRMLTVEVVSRRPVGAGVGLGGAAGAGARVGGAAGAPPPLPGAGTGLVGLAERVVLAGGELEHGPDAAGDFVLRATLPWPS